MSTVRLYFIRQQMYGGAYKLLRDCVSDFGIEATFVEDISISSVVSALTSKTKLVWLEACTNPTIVLLDVAALAKAIKNFSKDIIFGVDNTFLSPYILASTVSLGPGPSIY